MAEILMSEQLVSKTNSKDSVDLRDISTTLRKYKWLILAFTIAATLLTSLVISSVTPKYRSTVTLLFEKNKAKTGYENPWGEFGNLEDEIQTQLQVLRSRNFARKVVADLNLHEHWEYNPNLPTPERYESHGPLAPLKSSLKRLVRTLRGRDNTILSTSESLEERMARRFKARTKMYSVKGTSLIRISVDGIDKEMATKVANGAAKIYIQSFLDQNSGRSARAKDFLREKVNEFKANLERSEQALLEQRKQYGIQGDGGDLTKQTLSLLNGRLLDAKARLELARIQWNEVRNAGGSSSQEVVLTEQNSGSPPVSTRFVGTAYETLSIVDSNTLVQQKKQRLQETRRILDELNNRYGQKHPRVVDATSNFAVAVENLDRQIGNVISSVEKKYLALQGEVNSLQADIRREESRQYSLIEGRSATKEIELTRNTDRRFYEDALAELRDFQENDLQTTPMSIADSAVVPRQPFRPRKSLVTMLGFLLSLAGISVLLCAYEAQKETARGVNAFEKKLGIPVLGIIPTVKSRGFRNSGPLIPGGFEDKHNTFKEAIRTLRTRSTVSDLEAEGKVIMVTSSVPGEGKSTVATNLAYSLSKLENVVLVEADLRRPGIGRALGVKSDGLSDLLERKVYLEDCIRSHVIGNLDLIPAGKPRESDLELLASPEFGELVELLKSRYDRVILDLAPVQAVSDAMVVGKYTDSAIYVVKADSTPLPLVERGISLLREVSVKVSGAVISQVDLSKLGAYGGDYYYLGYFDYYGYADENDSDYKSSKPRAVTDYAERSRNRERVRESRRIAELKYSNGSALDPVVNTGNIAS